MPKRRQLRNAQPPSPKKAIGRADQPEDGVDLARRSSDAACSGVAAVVHLAERDLERAVEVGVAQQRDHVVLVDRLALGVAQEGGLEAGRGVELDLAVLGGRIDVEEDDHPVVEPGPPDAPLVDQRAGARPRSPTSSMP